MSEPLFLGIDLGTGTTKGVVSDSRGRIVATATAVARTSSPRPGYVEMDAEQDWWDAFVRICRDLLDRVGPERVAGVGVSGLGPCLVVLDEEGNPLRPGILYGIDRRAGRQIADMDARLGRDEILQRSGSALSSQAIGPKLAWIREEEPEVWERVARWTSAHGYVTEKLTGTWVLDHHTASQCNPLHDIRTQEWAADWAEELLPGLPLPPLAWPHEVIGTVTPAAAAATGLRIGTPVVAGTIDAWAEAFSAGVHRPGDTMLMYGSTMFLVQVLPAPAMAPGLWTTSGITPGSHTLAAGMATSGSLASWMHRLFGSPSYEQLVLEAEAVPAGSRGLLALPYFEGERSPIYDPDARGAVLGLTLTHGRPELFRAVHEGIALGLRQIFDVLDDVTGPPARIVAVGGGTQAAFWPQIVSDVTQKPQEVPRVTIGASYGDALLAAIGTGHAPEGTSWAKTERLISPRTENARRYDALYENYIALYPAVREQAHFLAQLQRETSAGA